MIFTLAIPLEYFAQGDYSLRTHKPRREDVLPFAIPLLRPVEPTAATREKKYNKVTETLPIRSASQPYFLL